MTDQETTLPLTIGSLFAGIGGLELGLERAGLGRTLWQVEIDPFCRSVLAKHWPEVGRFEDVKTVGANNLEPVDIVCGGFPCQDVSSAGKRAGLSGERSGLWFEYLRIVGELQPRIVIVENVASGKKLWLPTVRGGLESIGYRTRAFALSAADVGAPHLRRRIFVVAYAVSSELRKQSGRLGGSERKSTEEHRQPSWWTQQAEPPMVRMVHGVSRGMDGRRIQALGNAVVPQCAEVIGKIIAKEIL